MAADWRSSVTFSDRFTNISDLQQVLQSAQPDWANTELKAWPQSVEDNAYQSSTTKEQYEAAIQDQILKQQTLSIAPATQPGETEVEEWPDFLPVHPSTSPVDFGIYKAALPITDGSSSTVYRCPSPTDPSQTYALKVTTPSTQPAPHNSEHEVKILRNLHSHPNIIPLLDTLPLHNHLILVFLFLPCPLNAILRHPTLTLSPSRRKSILHDLFSALAFVHKNGIIHRDIKPSNILLSSPTTGPAKLIDFGTAWSARLSQSTEPAASKILDVGTTAYRPPELLFGKQDYGSSLDMWSAGCVAAEVLSPASIRCRSRWTAQQQDGEGEGPEGEEKEYSLFTSGALGSELALIKSQFETLGTPTGDTWPEAARGELPDWGKMRFVDYPAQDWREILPATTDVERRLVEGLVRFESTARLSAQEALEHEYFTGGNK